MMTSTAAVTAPLPWVVPPTTLFEGGDGNWSTFALEVGTPSQSFHVLPATLGQGVLVPSIFGCGGPYADLQNCGVLRGAENTSSRGFTVNTSSTWTPLGFFNIAAGGPLYSNTGQYGLDVLTLSQNIPAGFGKPLLSQLISAYATTDFWLGQFGLGPLSTNVSGHPLISSPLNSMVEQNYTNSQSFGYTAGQSYSDPQVPGSLVLGGYDVSRLSGPSLYVPLTSVTIPLMLPVDVTSITASQTLGGNTESLSTQQMTMNIDSSTSQIWLPKEVCETFATQFHLEFDNATSLYTINSTTHAALSQLAPEFVFFLSANGTNLPIKIPYSAFDMTYTYQYNSNGSSTMYFPIRQAANDSQLTLGRAFLQEAYIIVDWERRNLTIAQATSSTGQPQVMTIPPLSGAGSLPTDTTSKPSTSKGTSVGGIVGGVVGGILGLLAVGLGIWWWRRRSGRQSYGGGQYPPTKDVEQHPIEHQPATIEHYSDEVVKQPPQVPEPGEQVSEFYPPEKTQTHEEEKGGTVGYETYELSSPGVGPAELASSPRYELAAGGFPANRGVPDRGELMSTPLHEMAGSEVGSELDIGSRRGTRRRTPDIARSPPFGSPSPEMFGTPSPELFMSPIGSTSSVQVASGSAVHHFSSAHQEIVPSSEIVSSSAERDRLGGIGSEIVVSSAPQQVASPLPVRDNTSPLASQPAENLVQPHDRGTAERGE